MKKTYEDKITIQVIRAIVELEFVCKEAGIKVEQAIDWWNKKAFDKEESKRLYREKADEFVSKYVKGKEKKVCLETLCFLHDKETCPTASEIVELLNTKLLYAGGKPFLNKDARRILWNFVLMVSEQETCFYSQIINPNWISVRNKMFEIAKSL